MPSSNVLRHHSRLGTAERLREEPTTSRAIRDALIGFGFAFKVRAENGFRIRRGAPYF